MASEYCFVYMTAGSAEEARTIGEALVAERLAACVNMIGGMTSIYHWQGEIRRDAEVVMIAKTRWDRIEALTDRVKRLHSYDCPCVVVLPIEGGNRDFFDWIGEQVSEP